MDYQEKHGWDSKADFVIHLVENLIPDLIESGMEATAEDFESAVFFMLHDERIINELRQQR